MDAYAIAAEVLEKRSARNVSVVLAEAWKKCMPLTVQQLCDI